MKKLTVFLFFLFISIFSIYGTETTPDGYCDAVYQGTTKDYTIDELYIFYLNLFTKKGYTPYSLGKLSKCQSRLLWSAINHYDYEAGDIYKVTFNPIDWPSAIFCLIVEINVDGSCTWKGFSLLFEE